MNKNFLNLKEGYTRDINELEISDGDFIQEAKELIQKNKKMFENICFNDNAEMQLQYIENIAKLFYLRNQLAPVFAYQNTNQLLNNGKVTILEIEDFYDVTNILDNASDIEESFKTIDSEIPIEMLAIRKKRPLRETNGGIVETIFFDPYLNNDYKSKTFENFISEINVQSLKSLHDLDHYLLPTIEDMHNGYSFKYYSLFKKSAYRSEKVEGFLNNLLRNNPKVNEDTTIPQQRANRGYCLFLPYKNYSCKTVLITFYEICMCLGDFLGTIIQMDAYRT